MPGYEFKRIQEGTDAGKYIFMIDGVLQAGAFTMDECIAKIAKEDMPRPPDNPSINPCKRDCPARNIFCHAICPASKAYRQWRREREKINGKGGDAYRYTVGTASKRKDYNNKKRAGRRRRVD